MKKSIPISVLITQPYAACVLASCYSPNGADRNAGLSEPAYLPCKSGGSASMCCAQWDTCLSNGLCEESGSLIWRESCTDHTWESPECLQLCIFGSNSAGAYISEDVPVTECSDGSWCCGLGVNTTTCCDQGLGLWIVDSEVTAVKPSTILTSSLPSTRMVATASAATGSPAFTNPAMASAISKPRNTLSEEAVIGVVGGAAGVCVVLVGLISFYIGHRRRRQTQQESSEKQSNEAQDGGQPGELEAISPIPELNSEVANPSPINEMEQPRTMCELDGSKGYT